MNKRDFLGTVGASVAAASMTALLGEGIWAPYAPLCPARLAEDAAFWSLVRAKYPLKPGDIHLENGDFRTRATPVLDAFTFVRALKEIAA